MKGVLLPINQNYSGWILESLILPIILQKSGWDYTNRNPKVLVLQNVL